MAKGNAKRITAANSQAIQQVRLGFLISNAIYVIHLGLFRSGRTWTRLFYYATTEMIALVFWQQLEGMNKRGEELAQRGLTAYIFDIIYVTWFVHVTTALISTKFWYLYLAIPLYALYRLVTFALPFVRGQPSPASGGASAGAGASTATAEQPTLSKRQEKLKARQEKGQVKVQYR
ncbi:hypothetical protein OIO90_005449 [Microbotryomycetes sp. JL221]|nr:hypothetical protein OIO90_005449 [Microbotryomycetes sp. JL221]